MVWNGDIIIPYLANIFIIYVAEQGSVHKKEPQQEYRYNGATGHHYQAYFVSYLS